MIAQPQWLPGAGFKALRAPELQRRSLVLASVRWASSGDKKAIKKARSNSNNNSRQQEKLQERKQMYVGVRRGNNLSLAGLGGLWEKAGSDGGREVVSREPSRRREWRAQRQAGNQFREARRGQRGWLKRRRGLRGKTASRVTASRKPSISAPPPRSPNFSHRGPQPTRPARAAFLVRTRVPRGQGRLGFLQPHPRDVPPGSRHPVGTR